MALPYFPFYPEDWLGSSDVDGMSLEAQGAYIRLLARMWLYSKHRDVFGLPNDDQQLAAWCKVGTRRWRRIRAILCDPTTGVLRVGGRGTVINPRLEREWEKAHDLVAKKRKASHARASLRDSALSGDASGDASGDGSGDASGDGSPDHQVMHQVMPRSQIPPTGGEESARVGAREGTGTTDTDRYARDMARYAHLAIVTRRPTR